MIHRGPLQPLGFCDSAMYVKRVRKAGCRNGPRGRLHRARSVSTRQRQGEAGGLGWGGGGRGRARRGRREGGEGTAEGGREAEGVDKGVRRARRAAMGRRE